MQIMLSYIHAGGLGTFVDDLALAQRDGRDDLPQDIVAVLAFAYVSWIRLRVIVCLWF